MITMRYLPDNSQRARRRVQQPRWTRCRTTPLRFFVVIGLLLFTAHRLPAPVVEGPPPFKRTFFTLKGHAVDTFANEKKLPPELAPEFTHASVLATKPLTELIELMGRFGLTGRHSPTVLMTDPGDEEQTPEMQRREAAFQKIAQSQLKKIAANPILPLAAGLLSDVTFSASQLPSAFFADSAWEIESAHPEDLLTKGVKRPTRARVEIPLKEDNLRLFKYATKTDIEIMRRTIEDFKFKDDRGIALLRFYTEVSRGGAPKRLLPIKVTSGGCGEGIEVRAETPPLQMRVVVLENIHDRAMELGQFHFRLLEGRGMLAVRTRTENQTLLATMNAESDVWYKPRAVKPGEKVVVPLELFFKPSRSNRWRYPEMEPAATRARRRACANKLLADRELQTVALMYEGKDSRAGNSVPLIVMPKQKFADALLREPASTAENEEFVYGPSIALDSVDVNGLRYPIEPFDPINVAYFSGYQEGSCPFVYCHRTIDGNWLKQGTILTGRSSKTREGTGVLEIHAFDGTLRIAEEKEEISYIDELFVRGTLSNGETVTLRPTDDRIAHKDSRYLILKKGDSVDIKFSVPNGMRDDPVEVVASGFFELSPRPAAQ
jgi:hypothetical protein